MAVIALIAGILLPTFLGWVVMRVIEGQHPVLLKLERMAAGFLVGITLLMGTALLLNLYLALPFSRLGFLGVWLVLTLVAVGLLLWQHRGWPREESVVMGPTKMPSRWAKVCLWIFLVYTIIKLVTGALTLTLLPPYFDDTLNNWNIRGKIYWATQTYTLLMPLQKPTETDYGLNSYPPMVPLAKAWVNQLNGPWSEPLANAIHFAWFLAAIVLLWASLRRVVSQSWSLLGALTFANLPLVLMHGTNAYTDMAMAAHVLLTVSLLYHTARSTGEDMKSFLRLSIISIGLLPLIKNEGLLLYCTVASATIALLVLWKRKNNMIDWKTIGTYVGSFVALLIVLVLPWIIFKYTHGMAFGNGHDVSGFKVGWQNNVLLTYFINIFFEANWLFLFPLLILLLVVAWRRAFCSTLFVVTGYAFVLFFGQMLLYLFTNLSIEALKQTGLDRGIIHIAPLLMLITTVLLASIMDRDAVKAE